jgi:hypothetical protein
LKTTPVSQHARQAKNPSQISPASVPAPIRAGAQKDAEEKEGMLPIGIEPMLAELSIFNSLLFLNLFNLHLIIEQLY